MKARPLGRRGVVVGDRVRVEGDVTGDEGSLARIVEVNERLTTLRRTAEDDDPVERVIVANADQLAVVVAVADPEPQPRLIDRALVAAYDAGLAPLLCLTKSDLTSPDELLSTYRSLGVPWVVTQRGGDLSGLAERLAGRVSVLLGSSGVGKSTLVNALVPDADARGRGRQRGHRPRSAHVDVGLHARRCPTTDGGWIIDTPGIRSFGLAHVRPGGPDRGVPRPRRADRGLPPRLHPRRRRAGVRARRGGRGRAGRPRPGGVVPAAARRAERAGVLRTGGVAPYAPPDRPGPGLAGEGGPDQGEHGTDHDQRAERRAARRRAAVLPDRERRVTTAKPVVIHRSVRA